VTLQSSGPCRTESREVIAQPVAVGVSVELTNGALVVNASLSSGALNVVVDNLLDGTSVSWRQQMLEYTSYTGSGQKSVRVGQARGRWQRRPTLMSACTSLFL